MTFPTWSSEAEKAINSLATWEKLFVRAERDINFLVTLSSVKASGWALGKTEQECEAEAARRLQGQGGR